jgi:hypothetical protein
LELRTTRFSHGSAKFEGVEKEHIEEALKDEELELLEKKWNKISTDINDTGEHRSYLTIEITKPFPFDLVRNMKESLFI